MVLLMVRVLAMIFIASARPHSRHLDFDFGAVPKDLGFTPGPPKYPKVMDPILPVLYWAIVLVMYGGPGKGAPK